MFFSKSKVCAEKCEHYFDAFKISRNDNTHIWRQFCYEYDKEELAFMICVKC